MGPKVLVGREADEALKKRTLARVERVIRLLERIEAFYYEDPGPNPLLYEALARARLTYVASGRPGEGCEWLI